MLKDRAFPRKNKDAELVNVPSKPKDSLLKIFSGSDFLRYVEKVKNSSDKKAKERHLIELWAPKIFIINCIKYLSEIIAEAAIIKFITENQKQYFASFFQSKVIISILELSFVTCSSVRRCFFLYSSSISRKTTDFFFVNLIILFFIPTWP